MSNSSSVLRALLVFSLAAGVVSNACGNSVFLSRGFDEIWRMGLDGSGETLIHDAQGQTQEIRIHQGLEKMYWHEVGPSTNIGLRRANLDGTSPEVVIDAAPLGGGFNDFVLDEVHGHIYAYNEEDATDRQILRMNLDGSDVQTVLSFNDGGGRFLAIDAEDGKLYWSSFGGGAPQGVFSANLDGTMQQQLTTESRRFAHLAIDTESDRLYVSTFDSGDRRIQALDTDGTDLVDLIVEADVTSIDPAYEHLPATLTFNPFNDRIYWVNRMFSSNQIWSANPQGGMIEQFTFSPANTTNILGLDFLVPEPAGFVQLMVGLLVLCSRRWGRYRT